ncbi:MAG: triple tyrosine motif-containing protein, partial [Bacteroidota bacterium]
MRTDEEIFIYNQTRSPSLLKMNALTSNQYGVFRSMDTISAYEVLIKSNQYLHYLKLVKDKIESYNIDLSSVKKVSQFNAIDFHDDEVWMAGPYRLVKIKFMDTNPSDNFEIKEYVLDPTFFNAQFLDDGILFYNDRLYGYNYSGLWYFDESKFMKNAMPPPLSLSDIKLFNESVYDEFEKDASLEFDYGEHQLTFEMEAKSFARSNNVHYTYRLIYNRQSQAWSAPSLNREVVFSNLKDGNYTFEFKADNGEGIWTEEPYQINFRINRPFWKKTLFWCILAFLIALLYLFYKLYRNQQNFIQQQLLSQKLIQYQENERNNLAREIHDGIGQKMMLIAKQASSHGIKEMEALAKSALQETRTISQGLHPAVLERLGLSLALKDLVEKLDEQTEIFLDHEVEDLDDDVPVGEQIHVFRIAQELLSN